MNESKWLPIVLVLLQFATAAALVLSSLRNVLDHPLAWGLIVGGAVLGIWSWFTFGLRKITVLPNLRPDAALVTTGPYRYIRHPMYTAVLLFCGGFVFCPWTWWRTLLWLILASVVIEKARIEERLLRKRFAAYEKYQKTVGRFFPNMRRSP